MKQDNRVVIKLKEVSNLHWAEIIVIEPDKKKGYVWIGPEKGPCLATISDVRVMRKIRAALDQLISTRERT